MNGSYTARKSDTYKSGFLGAFAAKRIRPVDGVVRFKARTYSKNNPFLRILDRSVLENHIEQQEEFLSVLEKSKLINLNRNRLETMAGSLITLNFGDSLRIYAYHTERHFIQIDHLLHKRTD